MGKGWQTGEKGKVLTFIQAITKSKLKDTGIEKMVGNSNCCVNDGTQDKYVRVIIIEKNVNFTNRNGKLFYNPIFKILDVLTL